MKNGLRELGTICLLSLVPTLLAAWLHPVRPPSLSNDEVPSIAVVQAVALSRQQSILWIDARSESAFAAGHIPTARRLAVQDWEALLPGILEVWDPASPIIVYCDAAGCDVSRQVARRLQVELQADPVYVLEGGWEAWHRVQGK